MRPTTPIQRFLANALNAFLAWTMVLWPVTSVYGAPTPLADVPIAAKVSAKPNIIFTLDDSGSMQLNFLPDYAVPLTAQEKTNAGRVIRLGGITRVGSTATATAYDSINDVNVGDFVNIVGAVQPEYNGFVEVTSKTPTKFTYEVSGTPVTPATVAPGYGRIQILVGSGYCRSGNWQTWCTQQPVAISMTGSTITGNTISRAAGTGPVTATATNTAANYSLLNTGDSILIQHNSSGNPPGNASDPFYGVFIITKVNATTITYTINAVAGTPTYAGGNKQFVIQGGSGFAPPPLHAAEFNRLAYNPAVTYTAPKKDDGTPLTNTGTDANGNYGYSALKWGTPSVDRDPYSAYETAAGVTPMWESWRKDNLSIKIGVALYCNSDWPILENDIYFPGGPNGATAYDAGDSNGQYRAGAGAHCRINGTAYDASVATGAPAVTDDYNYPWRLSSGGPDGKYFYRQVDRRKLWCDKTSPYWPRNGTIIGCDGGTFVPGSSVTQYCKVTGSDDVCQGSYPFLKYTANEGGEFCDDSATYCGGSDGPGTGTLPECKKCTCVKNAPRTLGTCTRSDTNTPGAGSCNCVGAGCSVPACPNFTITPNTCTGGTPIYADIPATTVSCSTKLWDPVTGKNQTASLLDDAGAPNTTGAPGTTCRHNNYTYAVGGSAGPVKYGNSPHLYPGEGAGTGLFNFEVTGGCPTVGATVQIPRHYYVIDSVEFCNDRIVTANDQWRGFGTGTCKDSNDLGEYKEVKYGKFTRIDLFPSNSRPFAGNSNYAATSGGHYPKGPPSEPASRVWLDTTDPSPETSESINYANWYAYYSTRLNAAKTTTSQAFSYLTNVPPDPIAYRVGFHTLGEEPLGYGGDGTPIIWLDVADWDPAQRTAWYGKLFGIAVSTYKTPTLDAMVRIGSLVERGDNGGMPAYINPLPASAKDPFAEKSPGSKITCQANYHILFTDGKTNQVTPITTVADRDEDIDASLVALGATGAEALEKPYHKLDGLVAGAWPAPFRQGTVVPNTLADVAAYYWARDLRTGLKNDVPNHSGEKTGLTCTNVTPPPCTLPPYDLGVYDPGDYYYPALDPTKDVAFWQHVNFSAISFGAEGTLNASGQANQLNTLLSIKSGGLEWPNLTSPNNPIYPRGAGAGAVAVDDLWHATVMSRGSFVFARSPLEVSYGLASILAGIQNQRKSRAGAAFGGQVLDAGNDVIFEPTIEPGWAGDLLKIQIDPATGNTIKTWWSAAKSLAGQIDPVVTGVPEPWMDPDHRRIVTMNGTAGVPFQWDDISTAQRASLAPGATQQKKLIAYLRGGNSYSGTPIEGTSIGQFRKRYGAMGDISNAKPVIVFEPDRPYLESSDAGYAAYKTAKTGRAVRVVAPANDGMVHVFDAGPMPKAATSAGPAIPVSAGGGTEVFAYIPKALFKGEAGTVNEDASGIQALAYQDGGVPIYKHHMYVDSSPRVADVDFGSGGSNDWRTIVVGGLGKGGNSYYALDLTNPDAADEDEAAAKVLWEWSNSEVKYSYGRPVIVKVRDSGGNVTCEDGVKCRWVVIVTGGYDNTSGKGKVFFLDAKTGTLLSTVTTSAGQPSGTGQAAGLAQIHAFVKNQNNQIAEQIYGGDLLGNVWRIDVSAVDSYKAASAVLFAELTDPSGNPQPVTVAPQIEIDINTGVDRYVFIGTGRLLDPSDLVTPDPPQTQTMYAIRDGTLLAPASTGLPIKPRVTMKPTSSDGVSAIAGGAPNGWYHDLPNETDNSQRIVVDPQSNVNVAAYVGTKVQNDPCLISLPATLYARDYTTGEALTWDGSTVVNGIEFEQGLVDIETVGMIQSDGSQIVGIIGSQEVPGIKPAKIKNKFTGVGTRMSWRLLGGE
ncbi:MAG: hypothetical protein IT516_02580 [Burkholderiales bacterium]|nr:hypothetical protein [Burkholderiales bacterium]